MCCPARLVLNFFSSLLLLSQMVLVGLCYIPAMHSFDKQTIQGLLIYMLSSVIIC